MTVYEDLILLFIINVDYHIEFLQIIKNNKYDKITHNIRISNNIIKSKGLLILPWTTNRLGLLHVLVQNLYYIFWIYETQSVIK